MLDNTHQDQREDDREEPNHDEPAGSADGGTDGLRGGALAVDPAREDLNGEAAEAVRPGYGQEAVEHCVRALAEEGCRRLENRAARGHRRVRCRDAKHRNPKSSEAEHLSFSQREWRRGAERSGLWVLWTWGVEHCTNVAFPFLFYCTCIHFAFFFLSRFYRTRSDIKLN